jgi:hypothetical protein
MLHDTVSKQIARSLEVSPNCISTHLGRLWPAANLTREAVPPQTRLLIGRALAFLSRRADPLNPFSEPLEQIGARRDRRIHIPLLFWTARQGDGAMDGFLHTGRRDWIHPQEEIGPG